MQFSLVLFSTKVNFTKFRSKCQKICEQLDSANGIETPEHEWFWQSKTVERTDSSDEDVHEPEEEYDSDSEKSKSDNSDSDASEDVDDSNDGPKKKLKRKQINPKTITTENTDFTVIYLSTNITA